MNFPDPQARAAFLKRFLASGKQIVIYDAAEPGATPPKPLPRDQAASRAIAKAAGRRAKWREPDNGKEQRKPAVAALVSRLKYFISDSCDHENQERRQGS
jgi:hypothetical protein